MAVHIRLAYTALLLLAACASEQRPASKRAQGSASPGTPRAMAAPAPSAAPAAADAGPPAISAPRANRSLDRAALARLVEDARSSGTAELVISKDGELVADHEFDRGPPIQTMSITKSIISLAIGRLIDEGKLRLDQPIFELYPEWQKPETREITLLHLLSHTSGLEEGKSSRDIYARASFVEFTLRSKPLFPPGTHYEYSNRGANLLSGVVAKASKQSTDRYVDGMIFKPLGIRDYVWQKDRSGQPQGMAGLELHAKDLAKIGALVLSGGSWQGRRIVSETWIQRSTAELSAVQPQNKRLGLFWWLVPEWSRVKIDDGIVAAWRAAGVEEAFIEKVKPLFGREFDSVGAFVKALKELFSDPKLSEWNEATWKRGLQDARFEFGPIIGTYSAGTLGQYLVILPRDQLVAVRLRRSPKNPSDRDAATETFPDFVERVQALVH